MHRHLSVVNVDSSTAREKVSRADLQHDISLIDVLLIKVNRQILHAILTQAEVHRTVQPQYDKKDTTAESTDWI